jgi:uncharacterized protein (DUF169 family)
MADYTQLSTTLRQALDLRLPPIAISFSDSLPDGVPGFEGAVPAGCSFWELAAGGPFATTAANHALCSIGIHTHQISGAPANYESELGSVLKVLAQLDYVREQDIPGIPVMPRSSKYVVYSPLEQAPLPPDAVLVFADSRQGLVITEAASMVDEGVPPALGRPACAIVPQVANTGRAALSLGCCGARAYVGALDDSTALWAFPANRLEAYVERIAALAKANGILGRFHQLRAADVEAGAAPTYAESMERLQG